MQVCLYMQKTKMQTSTGLKSNYFVGTKTIGSIDNTIKWTCYSVGIISKGIPLQIFTVLVLPQGKQKWYAFTRLGN